MPGWPTQPPPTVFLISVVASECPPAKGERLPTLAQALSGVWEGAWNSGQWNAINQGRKRVGGEAQGDKMWRVEEPLRKAQPCGWG